ncbi:unnamed protein product [Chrysodeixis includens]|uniref:Snurportin-1 n=1 Tax=Chrysodeixis includens TaxID=689277 RepID=A0A9N8KXB1_CHRIL|nr:unnamed protein product [Chrysodeixis includens]
MDMDEVLEKLVTNIIDSDTESNNCGKKSFEGYYKNWGKLNNQEQRRKELLNTQKNNRNSKVDTFRGILNIINEDHGEDQVFKNHRNSYRPNIYVAGFTKASPSYKNVLMMSEWMIEKPADFHENWTVTPCPKGVRTLVVASNGCTKFYTKYGSFRFQCSTALPGGNRGRNNNRCCILDCFHVESLKTMFILDLLAWNSQPMTDGEAEFRDFWLKSQLLEIPGVSTLTNTNKMIFKLLPKVSCAKDSFDAFMSTMPHFPNHCPGLDGLLFFHKQAQYVSGQTPLVGWLYPFMVPELFEDVKIHPVYMLEVPVDYEGQAEYIKKFEENVVKKKEKKNSSENEVAMDTTAAPTEQNDVSTEVTDNSENEDT